MAPLRSVLLLCLGSATFSQTLAEPARQQLELDDQATEELWEAAEYAQEPGPYPALPLNRWWKNNFWTVCGKEVRSNLGGFGPNDTFPPELRYMEVGVQNNGTHNVTFDLVIKNLTTFKTNNPFRTGRQQCFGKINVASNTATEFSFMFVETETDIPFTLESFRLSTYNDKKGARSGAVHSVAMEQDMADFFLMPDTTVQIVDNFPWNGTDYIAFTGTQPGNGSTNPRFLQNMSVDELNKGITFNFTNTTNAKLVFAVSGGTQGRNFFFEGMSRTITVANVANNPNVSPRTCASCIIWGDPHIITFDIQRHKVELHPHREAFLRTQNYMSDQISISEAGTFWLVRSKRVLIQGTYNHSWDNPNMTALSSLAIGGPFLGNNTLVLRPKDGNCTWNGETILAANVFPSVFVNEIVTAFYHDSAEMVKDGTRGPGLDVTLPEGVALTVNRWKGMMAAKITMPSQHETEGGQGGHCGNYNGDPSDDLAQAATEAAAEASRRM